ncbi:DUF7694 domain-containing protein [Orrella sp. 11846]|uniref:DUF7694 domain-containing protein n=1 Tax=Orrella sp. 11846 TaxID=3409913 RepID=UPI003B5B33AA
MTFKVPNQYRIRDPKFGWLATDDSAGNNGAFVIPLPRGQRLNVIASSDSEWEHVSVSRKDRCPTWEEMCKVKELFWCPEDCVIQFHPANSDYVNVHEYCLHMWRPVRESFPIPEFWRVGFKT